MSAVDELLNFLKIIADDLKNRKEKIPRSLLRLYIYCDKYFKANKFEIKKFKIYFKNYKDDLLKLSEDGYIYFPNNAYIQLNVIGKEDFFEKMNDLERRIAETELIEGRVRASIGRVLEYFKHHGVNLGYFPTFTYLDIYHPLQPHAAASVKADIDFMLNLTALINARQMKLYYKRMFNLELSDETIEESIQLVNHEMKAQLPSAILDARTDILLYKPLHQIMELDQAMAHEVWHLIEQKYGVLTANGLIFEGTATYVGLRFGGDTVQSRFSDEEFRSFYENDPTAPFFIDSAILIEKLMQNEENPFLAILSPEKRAVVQKYFEERVLPVIFERLITFVDSNQFRDYQRNILSTHKVFDSFRREPTRENYLKAVRELGFHKLADDLSRQNIDVLLNFQRGLIA